MSEAKLKIKGMSCHHCVMSVRKALGMLDGVKESEVEVGSARVVYDESKVSVPDMEKTLSRLGYEVVK